MPRRPPPRKSLFVPILLMFLIPYSLAATGVIVWLLYSRSRIESSFERLRDPHPKEGGPERVKHDASLPAKLQLALKSSVQIGDTEITPLKVGLLDGDLVLHLKLKNRSTDLAFNPLPGKFLEYNRLRDSRPYTFLDPGVEDLRCYGGSVAYLKGTRPQL